MRVCGKAGCGLSLEGKPRNAKYCSAPCRRKSQKDYYQTKSGAMRAALDALWTHHQMTMEELEERHTEQEGRCANFRCGKEIPLFGKDRNIDHDRSCCPSSTKTCGRCTRGLLCASCNKALGFAADDVAVLAGLIDYLQKSKKG